MVNKIKNARFYPVQKKFIFNHSLLQIIMGPVGSGKSVASLFKILMYAMCIRPGPDGIRRSRFIVVRNTIKELRNTTIQSYLSWFRDIGDFKHTEMKDTLIFDDVHCEIWFQQLDNPEDKQKLLSLEMTGIYFNELSEIDPEIYDAAFERVGRYPEVVNGGAIFDLYKAKELGFDLDYSDMDAEIQMDTIFADTNPPMMGSHYQKLIERELFDEETGEDKNPKNLTVLKQPSGLSEEAENIINLPGGYEYYYRLVENKSQEIVNTRVHVQYDICESGLGIFRNHFRYKDHVYSELYEKYYSGHYKLAIGIDFGLEPACVIGQYIDNKLIIYQELITRNTNKRGLEEFLKTELIPILRNKYYKHKLNEDDIVILGDPAGNQRNQLTGVSLNAELKKHGFKLRSGISGQDNKIPPRIESVKKMLSKDIESQKLKMIIDKSCDHLIKGLGGLYYYEKDKQGISDTPCKNTYSHINDALQYLCLHVSKYGGRYLDTSNVNLYDDSYSYNGPVSSVGGY